jgi:hypothetical protein
MKVVNTGNAETMWFQHGFQLALPYLGANDHQAGLGSRPVGRPLGVPPLAVPQVLVVVLLLDEVPDGRVVEDKHSNR